MSEHENVTTVRGIYEAFARGDIPHILDQLRCETTGAQRKARNNDD